MLTTEVNGRVELRKVQGLLAASDRELRDALAKNTRAAIKPIKEEIPAAAVERMPSGYGPTLAKATKVNTRVTAGQEINATIKVTAKGKAKPRDVKATDAGNLRHPLFGDRSSWHRQEVPRGWVSDPVEATRKRIIQGAQDAADHVADTIGRD